MALAIHAEHFIRYTFEDFLPRLAEHAVLRAPLAPPALGQVRRRERAAVSADGRLGAGC